MTKSKRQKRNSYDSPWKTIVESQFREFLDFFFPEVGNAIDWNHAPEFLDTELPKILSRARDRSIYADKLVKVRGLDGTNHLIFVHVEVQAKPDPTFAYRMFQYNIRIHERFEKHAPMEVTSLAVLADASPSWRPNSFERSAHGTMLQFRFSVVKLLDIEVRCNDLLRQGENPFAWVVRAHLDSMATRREASERLARKQAIARCLYRSGFSERVIREILIFLDWVLMLPESLEASFDTFLEDLEDNMGREYVPSWERRAIRKESITKICRFLEKRLNGESQPFVASIAHLTDAERDELFDFLFDTTDPEKIRTWFATHPVKKPQGN